MNDDRPVAQETIEGELREAARRQRLLSEISRILLDYTGSDEVEPLRRIVPRVVEGLGGWCAFALIHADGTLRNAVFFHPDPEQQRLGEEIDRLSVPQRWDAGPPEYNSLVQKQPVVIEEITDEMLRAGVPDPRIYERLKELQLTSVIAAPMIVGNEPLGTLSLFSTHAGRRYKQADVDFAFTLAGRAALAIRNARLVGALDSERRRAEQQAAELFAVLRSDPNGIAIFGPDDRLRFASPMLEALLGFDYHSQVGRRFDELARAPGAPQPTDLDGHVRSLAAIFAERQGSTRELMGWTVRDQRRWFLRSSSPIQTSDGSYLGRLFVYADVTQEQELERQRAEFLTVAAHELRTPLTPLSIFLQTLERRLARGEPGSPELIQKARRQIGRLETLVADLLDVSRIESGGLQLRKGPVPLDALVAEVVEDFRASARNHELALERPAVPLEVEGDRERLEQVLVNLLANAVKYSPHGGRIDIAVQREGDEAVVSVRDPGIGVPPEEQPRLFQRFFRATNATASHYGGMGIGLYVSHDIVRRHGGRFEVESAVGQGTTIRFRLPAREAQPRRRILLVDDDTDIVEATASFLGDEGYAVETAVDGAQALSALRRSAPDLLLLDLMMPVLDGRALLDKMRQERLAAGVPVVVFSADRDVRQKAREVGASDVLVKPFALDELLALVQRHLS